MPGKPNPEIPLPKGWPTSVKSTVLRPSNGASVTLILSRKVGETSERGSGPHTWSSPNALHRSAATSRSGTVLVVRRGRQSRLRSRRPAKRETLRHRSLKVSRCGQRAAPDPGRDRPAAGVVGPLRSSIGTRLWTCGTRSLCRHETTRSCLS